MKIPKDTPIYHDDNGEPFVVAKLEHGDKCLNCEVLWEGKYIFTDGKGNCDKCGKPLDPRKFSK